MNEVEFMLGLGGPIAGLKGIPPVINNADIQRSQQRLSSSVLEKLLRSLVDWHTVVEDKEKK